MFAGLKSALNQEDGSGARCPYLRWCNRRDVRRYLDRHGLGVYEQPMNSSCEPHDPSFPIVKSREVQGNVAVGEAEVKPALPLADQDKDGKVSKQGFRKFMKPNSTGWIRTNDGKLDVKKLNQKPAQRVGGFQQLKPLARRAGPRRWSTQSARSL